MSTTVACLIEAKHAASSSATEYTSAASTRTIVDKFTATNTDSSDRTISVWIVPSGGTEADTNLIVKTKNVVAGTTVDLTDLQNQVLEAGDFIRVVASVASKVTIRASGRNVT